MGRVAPIQFSGYDQFAPGVGLSFPTDEPSGLTSADSSRGPVPTPTPSRSAVQKAKGIYPFQGQSQDELSFQPGDVLNIVSQNGDWWTAEMNGRQGLIPANYVQLI